MKKMTETELSTVAGASHKPSKKIIVKKIGSVHQRNSFDATQALADFDVGGDLDVSALAEQSNENSGTVS